MIHSSWLWEAPRSTANCCWATLRPETEATTATSARIIAIRMFRRRRVSVTTPDTAGLETSRVLTWGVLVSLVFRTRRSRTISYETVSYCLYRYEGRENDETSVTSGSRA